MDIKNMHEMIEAIVGCAKSELFEKGISAIDSEEFEEITCSIKNLAEARYYQTLTKAMEAFEYGEEYDENGPKESEKKGYRGQPRDSMGRYISRRGYEDKIPVDYKHAEHMRDMDRYDGRMYYTDTNTGGSMANRHQMLSGDGKEGRSGMMRRSYMEAKEMHKGNTAEDKQKKMKELENYVNELSGDITDMIMDASPEEKSMLKSKLTTLASKIG